MHVWLGIAAGAAFGVILIWFAHTRDAVGARRIFAVGLFVTQLLYVLLAATRGATSGWVIVEMVGVLIYGGAAWLGAARWPLVLALGWAAHVIWDLTLHVNDGGGLYTPDWWPWFCLSFDLILAGVVLKDAKND